ncbi:IQ domain-containing protein M [Pithys albifrons albifrons]|uniref:IQ domain-containing protein M n=1 Tax=Pithys albifrons albifrons TaxID=3385563 RepID=UPI003A5D0FC5
MRKQKPDQPTPTDPKEKEASQNRSLDLLCSSSRPCGIPGFQITHKVYKALGIVQIYPAAAEQLQNVTHLEGFEASRGSRKHPNFREALKPVISILRYLRRWFEHRAFKKVKIEFYPITFGMDRLLSVLWSHGPSLPAAGRYYCKITCFGCPVGVWNLSPPLWHFELEVWIDKKKFFGFIFSQREFDKKIDRHDFSEVLRYSSTAAVRTIKKHQAFEMAFTLFPLLAAKLKNLITVLLPWVHCLMDEKD